jgi:hypothetical protein
MIDYAVKIAGDNRVALRFDRFPEMAHDGLVEKIEQLTESLEGAVEAAMPHGKTGRLEAQLKSGVEEGRNRIRGWVSLAGASANDVRKAAALEYGSRGAPFPVRGYLRTLDQVFGRMTAPFDQVVAAYRRAGGLAELDFLHGPLGAGAQSALAELNAVVEAAIQESE